MSEYGLNEWGLEFIDQIEEEYEDDPEFVDTNSKYCMEVIIRDHSELTKDQRDWLYDFYGDLA